MTLTYDEILSTPDIQIIPFREENLGPCSYDVHLHPDLMIFDDHELDCRVEPRMRKITIPSEGFMLYPGHGYLGCTVETVRCAPHIRPSIEGKSSVGRMFLSVHQTASGCNTGFCGQWTLELTTLYPLRIYAGMPIGQITFERVSGTPKQYEGQYQNSQGPQASRLWKHRFFQ